MPWSFTYDNESIDEEQGKKNKIIKIAILSSRAHQFGIKVLQKTYEIVELEILLEEFQRLLVLFLSLHVVTY